jgi:hypothetical protein
LSNSFQGTEGAPHHLSCAVGRTLQEIDGDKSLPFGVQDKSYLQKWQIQKLILSGFIWPGILIYRLIHYKT